MATASKSSYNGPNHLCQLPPELFQRVLSCLAFDQVANARATCRYFDKHCSIVLNSGFKVLEQKHAKCWQIVKSRLPRRESERRKHVLARHNDILSAFETRLSLLSMTYLKFIELSLCCFIPGRVLDEAFDVLRVVDRSLRDANEQPPKPLDLLQELRDVSSMAMEYFDERIAPGLKDTALCTAQSTSAGPKDVSAGLALLVGASSSKLMEKLHSDASPCLLRASSGAHDQSLVSPPFRPAPAARTVDGTKFDMLKGTVGNLQKRVQSQSAKLVLQQNELCSLRATSLTLSSKVRLQHTRIAAQNRLIGAQAKKIEDLGKTVKELNKRVLEYGARLSDAVSERTPDRQPTSRTRATKRKATSTQVQVQQQPPAKRTSPAGRYNLRRR